jgi:hypothetical protein
VKHGEHEVPHVRVSVGQMSGAAQRCSILDSARELAIGDPHAYFVSPDKPAIRKDASTYPVIL